MQRQALEQALAASEAEGLARERVLTKQQVQIEELQRQAAEFEARLATARAVAPTRLDNADAQGASADGAAPSPVAALPVHPADGRHGDGPELAPILASTTEAPQPVTAAEPSRMAGAGPGVADAIAPGSAATEDGGRTPASTSVLMASDEFELVTPLAPGPMQDEDDWIASLPDVTADASARSESDSAAAATGEVQAVTAVDSYAVDALLPEPARMPQPGKEGRTVAAHDAKAKPARPRGHPVKPPAARAAGIDHPRAGIGVTPYAAVSARLLDAAERGDGRLVQDLLGAGASVDVRDERGRTPLMLAAGRGHLEVARMLLDRGAAIGAANTSLGTALAHAAWAVTR